MRCCGGLLRSGACPPPVARPRSGLSWTAASVLWPSVLAWGPATVPFACMPCGRLCATGWLEVVPGGWPPTIVRGVLCQALSSPRLPVSGGGQPGPVAHLLWARVCGRGCIARPWGGRPGVGACGVCGVCAAFVCCWVCGGAVCAMVPWCVVLRPPGAPLSLCLVLWCVLSLVAVPPSPRAPSLWCVPCRDGAFFTLSSTLCWLALLPVVRFSLPPLCRAWPSVLLCPVRQKMDGGVGCWGLGDCEVTTHHSRWCPRCGGGHISWAHPLWFVCVWRCCGCSAHHMYGVGDL